MLLDDYKNGLDTILEIAETGYEALGEFKRMNAPKNVRLFSMSEAASMVGCSPSHIRKQEEKGTPGFPGCIRQENDRRAYTLDAINAMRDAYGTRKRRPENADPVVISYINYKGGPGKTTTAVHAAQALALRGYRVLVIDGDPQASATEAFSLPSDPIDRPSLRYGLVPITDTDDMFANHRYDQNIDPLLSETHWGSVYVIPANPALHDVEFELRDMSNVDAGIVPWGKLKKPLLETARRKEIDMIILDGQPHLSLLTVACVDVSDIMMMPARMSGHDIWSTVTFAGKLHTYVGMFVGNMVKREVAYQMPRIVRILPTQYDAQSSIEYFNFELVRKIFPGSVMQNPIHKSDALKYSSNSGALTVFEDEKAYPGSASTAERARGIINSHADELESYVQLLWGAET